MNVNAAIRQRLRPRLPLDGAGPNLDWALLERTHHLKFPDDYKEFIEHYGYVSIRGFLRIYTPFSDNATHGLPALESRLESIRQGHTSMPELYPLAAYPAPDGLLPWAATVNADVVCWVTTGPANSWKSVIHERGPGHEYVDLSMTEFVLSYLDRKLRSDIFGRAAYRSRTEEDDPRPEEP